MSHTFTCAWNKFSLLNNSSIKVHKRNNCSVKLFLIPPEGGKDLFLIPMGIYLITHMTCVCFNPFLDCELLEGKNHAFLFYRYPYGLIYYACSTNNYSTKKLLSLTQNIRVEGVVLLVIIFICHDYNLRHWVLNLRQGMSTVCTSDWLPRVRLIC